MKSLNQSLCKGSAGRAKSLVSNYTQHNLPLCLIAQAQNTPLFALKTAWIFTQTDDATAPSQFSGSSLTSLKLQRLTLNAVLKVSVLSREILIPYLT